MILSKFVKVQLAIFSTLTVVAVLVMGVSYMQIPAMVGLGKYKVIVMLPTSGGLYGTANVSYRGVTVGTVTEVIPTTTGAQATLRLDSGVKVPAEVTAQIHSRSAIGEQYVDLVPQTEEGPTLGDGDVIPESRTTVPQDIAPMIDTVNQSLESIPQEKLTRVIDEAYRAFNGTAPDLQRLLGSAHALATDAAENAGQTATLIRDAAPFLDSQVVSSDAIRSWVQDLGNIAQQAESADPNIRSIFDTAPSATHEVSAMFDQMRPTLPILVANLTSLGQVAVTYNRGLEQILVVVPAATNGLLAGLVPNSGGSERSFLNFNLNMNLATEPCTTGFLPASERRDGSAEDTAPRIAEPTYCALPQDSPIGVRGSRNLPCMDKPGKRAPTIEICKSDEEYVPLGTSPWVGNPTPVTDNPLAAEGNAAFDPGSLPAHAPVGAASYSPSTGRYRGSDGQMYEQSNLKQSGRGADNAAQLQTLLTAGR